MVRNLFKAKVAIVALLAAATVFASDSGTLSYRAQRSFNNGRFAKSYGQLERALLASRKEADLLSEARVLLSMVQIRTMSLDLDFADSLLSVIRPEVLDKNTSLIYRKSKISLLNERNDFKAAVKLCNEVTKDSLSKTEDEAQAAFFSECAIAQAAVRDSEKAEEALKMTGKRSSKKGGFYAFTAARMADLRGESNADSLYLVAEEKAIKANKPYNTATILYYRAQLKTTAKEDSEDMLLRCKNAFELMGLPNNAKRCGE